MSAASRYYLVASYGLSCSKLVAQLLKRYGDKARAEVTARTDALAAAGDREGAAVWRRITDDVLQLDNKTPPGPMH